MVFGSHLQRSASLLAVTLILSGPAFATQPADDGAFRGAQWVMASAAARAVAKVGARAAIDDPELAALVRDRQNLDIEIDKLRKNWLTAVKDGDAAEADLREALEGATARAEAMATEVRQRFPTYDEIANPRPQSIADVRNNLAEGEARLATLTASGTVYVWVITRNEARWNRLSLSAEELSEKVAAIRRTVGGASDVRGADSLDDDSDRQIGENFARQEAFDVYAALLAPFAETLAGIDHLYSVVDGSLTSLPFAMLLTEAPAAALADRKPLRDAPFLLHDMAVTTLPSITSLATVRGLSNTKAQTKAASFVGFGDPLFAGPDATPVSAAREVASLTVNSVFRSGGAHAIRSLAPLPGTRRELNDIASVFGSDSSRITLGAEASETAVKKAPLAGASVVAFATHGLLAGELDGLAEPALVFTPPETPSPEDDGLLTASEVAALDLNAEWVILSACNTAGGDGSPGAEGLSGLAQAFLFAGARSILVSHWPVRDDAAARLTVDTLAVLRAEPGLARSEAMRRAMLKMFEDERDPSLAHPSAWAPFVLVGDGGKPLTGSAQ